LGSEFAAEYPDTAYWPNQIYDASSEFVRKDQNPVVFGLKYPTYSVDMLEALPNVGDVIAVVVPVPNAVAVKNQSGLSAK
jgi:hypothetical protein